MRLFTATALSLFVFSPMALAQTAAPGPGAAPAAAPAPPPSPAAMQLAQKLYDDNKVGQAAFDNLTGNVIEGAFSATRRAMSDKGVTTCPGLQTPWNNFQQRMTPMLANLADAQFRQSVVTLYASAYSETELRDITNFVESASGKKFLATDPRVGQQIMQMASEKAKPRESQVNAAMVDYGNNVKTALAACPSSAPAQPQSDAQPAKKHTRK